MVDIAVKKIRPADQDLSTVQDNLANCIQQLLDFANGSAPQQSTLAPVMQQVRGPGTPTTVKVPALKINGRPDGPFIPNQPTIVWGDAATTTAKGQAVAQRDAELFSYGQIVAFGSQVLSDGFVLIPQVPGAAFRIAPRNASTVFQVEFDGTVTVTGQQNINGGLNASGTVSATSIGSAQGFKSWLPPMFYWNGNFPGGLVNLTMPVTMTTGNVCGTVAWIQPMPRAGSITALTAAHSGAINMVCAIYIYKNGAQLIGYNITGNASTGQVSFAKGTYSFAAGDTLTAKVTYSSANINVCTQIAMEIETRA